MARSKRDEVVKEALAVIGGAAIAIGVASIGFTAASTLFRWNNGGVGGQDNQTEEEPAEVHNNTNPISNPSKANPRHATKQQQSIPIEKPSKSTNNLHKQSTHTGKESSCNTDQQPNQTNKQASNPTNQPTEQRNKQPRSTPIKPSETQTKQPRSHSHVFISFADLTTFECDAWAIPTKDISGGDTDRQVLQHTCSTSAHSHNRWLDSDLIDKHNLTLERYPSESDADTVHTNTDQHYPSSSVAVARVVGLPERKFACPFIVCVSPDAARNAESANHFLHCAETFLKGQAFTSEHATREQQPQPPQHARLNTRRRSRVDKALRVPRNRRCRFLIALPVLGTGAGGARSIAGSVIHRMLTVLHEFVQRDGACDVALVTNEHATYAALQAARASLLFRMGPAAERLVFPLGDELRKQANRLAKIAKEGRLALFIGAGTSIASGLPMWKGLLDHLAIKANVHKTMRQGPSKHDDDTGYDSDGDSDTSSGNEVQGNGTVATSASSIASDLSPTFVEYDDEHRSRVDSAARSRHGAASVLAVSEREKQQQHQQARHMSNSSQEESLSSSSSSVSLPTAYTLSLASSVTSGTSSSSEYEQRQVLQANEAANDSATVSTSISRRRADSKRRRRRRHRRHSRKPLVQLACQGSVSKLGGPGDQHLDRQERLDGLVPVLRNGKVDTQPRRLALMWFHQLGYLDRARVIEQGLSRQGIELGDAVSKVFQAPRGPSLGTCLLASLPINTAVTTNYDMLFESAWAADMKAVNVLPHSPKRHAAHTLLKMHGCVTRPKEIVLTRGHYLGYEESKAALGALVQATLLTKHMLFVGFSMSDDNFHRLFHSVRKAADRDTAQEKEMLGTVLAVGVNPLQAQLWEGHLDYVSIQESIPCSSCGGGGVEDNLNINSENLNPPKRKQQANSKPKCTPMTFGELCRFHDIFLDYLAFRASDNHPHLLNSRFSSLLSPNEHLLSSAVTRFLRELPAAATTTVAWNKLEQNLKELGLETDSSIISSHRGVQPH